MRPIDSIFIACQRHDAHYARACLASIRRWTPEIPVSLIKDEMYGGFDTRDMERAWGAGVFKTDTKRFGWGFSKLEPLFEPGDRRVLILDADTIFTGPVIPYLEGFDDDFLVQQEEPTREFVESHAFSLDRLASLDRDFVFPGYTFNTGQFVARCGLLVRSDFDRFVRWEQPRQLAHPGVFKMGEQGLLNYMFQKKAAAGAFSLRRVPMMELPTNARTRMVEVCDLNTESPHAFIIHWCGTKGVTLQKSPRGDILSHFERAFYARLPLGGILRFVRVLCEKTERCARTAARSMRQKPKVN